MENRDIIKIQNEKKYLSLLKAQRVAYSQAKLFQIFDLISVVIAVIFPIVVIYNYRLLNILSGVGVVWTIIYLIAEGFRKKKTIEGAKIQEQFDTELFDIEWNSILVGEKIKPDKIYDLGKKNKNESSLSNWYSTKIPQYLPKNIKIILCQRINSSWELDLRNRFVWVLITLIVVYYGIFITILIIKNIGLFDVLLLLSPSISFSIYGIQHSIALKKQVKSKNELLTNIDKIIDKYSKSKKIPTEKEIRQIQDVIYNQRTVPEKIPDWFYKKFRNYNENKTDKLIGEFIKKF